MASVEQNKACVAAALEEHWNQMDWSAAGEHGTQDLIVHAPGGMTTHGLDEFQNLAEMVHGAFPDYHLTIHELIGEGDKVVARFRWTGTNTGELMGMRPTGEQIALEEVNVYRLTPDAKIAEIWAHQDMMAMMEQLGLAPPGPPPKALILLMRVTKRLSSLRRGSGGS